MKKILLLLPLFILALAFVNATTLDIASDNYTEYYDGVNWQSAVAVTDISYWTSITIPATWIWSSTSIESSEQTSEQFRRVFNLPCSNVQNSLLTITADNEYVVLLNDVAIAVDNSDGNWNDVETYNIPSGLFNSGSNVLTIDTQNYAGSQPGNPAGLIYTLSTNYTCSSSNHKTPAIVTGNVTYTDGTYVDGAEVVVVCNNISKETITNELGDYYVEFTSDECDYGSSVVVTATKDEVTGTNTGNTCKSFEDCEIPVALINVTIPEFTVIGGAIVLLAGIGIVIYRRKN
jgi:hypothetical protein